MPSLPRGAFTLQTVKTTGPGCIALLAFAKGHRFGNFP
jgi:hypothetical protein